MLSFFYGVSSFFAFLGFDPSISHVSKTNVGCNSTNDIPAPIVEVFRIKSEHDRGKGKHGQAYTPYQSFYEFYPLNL